MSDIDRWLADLGLEKYAPVFAANDIDRVVLPELTEQDLEKLGISLGHRKKLLKAISALQPKVGIAPAAEERTQSPEAERRQLMVMFCDLVGSTELSRRLDPEDFREVIGAYQEVCSTIVAELDGRVAKFLGDGVLIYFGYPRAHEDDAERAVRTGLKLVQAVAAMPTRFGPSLQARVGIATGPVVVGEVVGTGAAQEQAVVGETPTLAARLQTLAEPGTVVVAAGTRRLLAGLFDYRDLGGQSLKGFNEPVPAWLVIGEARAESRFEALHGAVLTPLVGREHAAALLLDRWERAKDGEGQVVLVSGEAGIGKSRIAQSLRERLGNDSCTSLRYDCSPYHQNSALYPFIVQLEKAAELTRSDPPDVQLEKLECLLERSAVKVPEAVPLLAALLSIPSGDRYSPLNLTPQRQKEKTLAALADQLAGLAAERPALMIVEDAHWLDPTSLEFLDLVVHRVKDLPILLIVAFRTEFSPPWIGHGHISSLQLGRLSRRQSADLVVRIAADNPLSPEVVGHIVARAEGVPLFVEEVTRAVLESGSLGGQGVRKVPVDSLTLAAIPATLHDSLMARLDRLPAAKQVAQIGAVIGRDFSYEALAALAPTPESVLREALRQLVESQIVFCRGTIPNATFRFKHVLVQDAAYESLLRSRRQQLHANTAAILEQRFPELAESEPELLAHHFTQAAMPGRAIAYCQKAARRAADRSIHPEAIGHLKKAANLVPLLPDGPERERHELSILLALGVSLQDVKGPGSPETEKAYVRARELGMRTGSANERFAALWGLWRVHNTRSEVDSARTLADELLRFAREEDEPAFLLQAYHALWSTQYEAGGLRAILDHVAAGLALYDVGERRSAIYVLSGHDPGVCGLGSKADATWQLGFPSQAAKAMDDALALARTLDNSSTLGLALSNAIELYLLIRVPDRLRSLCDEMIALATEQGFAIHLATATFGLGWALAEQGHSEEGIEHMRKGSAGLRASRKKSLEMYHQALLAEAYCRVGNAEQASSIIHTELAFAIDPDAEQYREAAEVHRLSGEVLLTLSPGEQSRAESCFHRAIDSARREGAKSLELRAAMSLARLWRDQGRAAEAHKLLAPVYGWFTEGFDTPDLAEARTLVDSLA